jgi:hypothetical protein
MKKILLTVAVAIMAAMSAQAQKIQIVDNDGNAIPLVSVMTEDGTLIGTTDLDGVLADVKGTQKVAVTHVAYKPQLVAVASLQNGRITMEDIDYGYMDKNEFKDKKQDIKDDYKSASLESLESYATAHGVPALSPSVRQAVKKLTHMR